MKPSHAQVGFAIIALAVCAPLAPAQQIQFPRGTTPPPTISVPAAGGMITPAAPGTTAINPYTGAAAPFDPYSSSGSSAYSFWSTAQPSNTTGVFSQPPVSPYAATSPLAAPPGSFPTYGPPPASPYATTANPQFLFPNGVNSPQFDISQSIRFVQDVRFRNTYIDAGGDDSTDLGINDAEVAVTFTIPNFLTSGQPLFISPAFAFHNWDGPRNISADLPPNAYSAYLDFQFSTDANLQIGAELGFRVGVYSDFEILNEDSLRLQGLALGVFRFTPTLTGKVGVMYLDRNRIKLLPAGGVLWTPTPQVRFDFFFPQPKLSAYLTTVGRYEVWWYLAGEYGGGAWTIERADGTEDAIDINDIRVSAGFEWSGPRGVTGFFESGFVFDREVIYVVNPADNFSSTNTFMIRAGFSF